MDIYATHTHTHTHTHTNAHTCTEPRAGRNTHEGARARALSLSHTHTHTRTQAFPSRRSRVSRLARLARAALSTSANARFAPMPSAAAFSLSVSLAADGSYATWACPGPYVTGHSHPPMLWPLTHLAATRVFDPRPACFPRVLKETPCHSLLAGCCMR